MSIRADARRKEKKQMRTRTVLLATGATIALTIGGTTAYAAVAGGPVDSGGVVHACFTNAAIKGSHAIVLQDAGTTCPSGTTAVTWNQQGPAGATGAVGAKARQDRRGQQEATVRQDRQERPGHRDRRAPQAWPTWIAQRHGVQRGKPAAGHREAVLQQHQRRGQHYVCTVPALHPD